MIMFGIFGKSAKSSDKPSTVAASRVAYSEYCIRVTFRGASQTRIEPWVIAPNIDEAIALSRRRYPTAAAVEFTGSARDIPEAEAEAHRAAQTVRR
jgi:hypothetical protein